MSPIGTSLLVTRTEYLRTAGSTIAPAYTAAPRADAGPSMIVGVGTATDSAGRRLQGLDVDGNGLASIGIGAVCWVEFASASSEGCELISRPLEGVDVAVEIVEMNLEELRHVLTGWRSLLAQLQDGADFREGETCRLGVANEAEPFDDVRTVRAVPVRSAFGFRQDTDVFVVADGLGGHTGLAGEFSDLHLASIAA